MLYGSKSLGNKDIKLFSCYLSLNNVNTWNMDNWVICLLSLVSLSWNLGAISAALSVLPVCSGEERDLISQTATGNQAKLKVPI